MRIEFVVQGLPPKQGDDTEAPTARDLRRAATDAVAKLERRESPPREIRLELELHLPAKLFAVPGEFGTFIGGIRDGLVTACGERGRIADDTRLVAFVARKVQESSSDPWYRVVLEGTS